MEYVSAHQSKVPLQIQRAEALSRYHAFGEAGRITVEGLDDEIGDFLSGILPRPAVRQFRCHVLTEEASDMSSRRGESAIEGRGYDHFDQRLPAPASFLGVAVSSIHVGETWPDDDVYDDEPALLFLATR